MMFVRLEMYRVYTNSSMVGAHNTLDRGLAVVQRSGTLPRTQTSNNNDVNKQYTVVIDSEIEMTFGHGRS